MTKYLEWHVFFLKKIMWGPGGSKFHLLWIRFQSPQILRGSNFIFTLGHPFLGQNKQNVSILALSKSPTSEITSKKRATVKKLTWSFSPKFFFVGQYTCGDARKKFWHKKSMKNFSRSTHTWRVPESHPLFEFFHFLMFGLFWARNYDLKGGYRIFFLFLHKSRWA